MAKPPQSDSKKKVEFPNIIINQIQAFNNIDKFFAAYSSFASRMNSSISAVTHFSL